MIDVKGAAAVWGRRPARFLARLRCVLYSCSIYTMNRLAGTLLGTALGDALGLPAEGLSPRAIARRFGRVDRFHLLGRTGFVSDDTEQSALVAQSLARFPDDPTLAADAFRRSLVGWFARLPWGIGLATLRACARAAAGLRPSGVRSAGNGAAMRSAIIGTFFRSDPIRLRAFATNIAEVTHTDPRGVEGALFVAALAAACARSSPGDSRLAMFDEAVEFVVEPSLREVLLRARALANEGASLDEARAALKTTGFILHTAPFAAFCFLRFRDSPLSTLTETIAAGGDTDSIAAIVGGWLGALTGEEGLPAPLIAQINDGPFGPTHLRALARCLDARSHGTASPVPGYSAALAIMRNLALFPVVLAHGFRRLWPWRDACTKECCPSGRPDHLGGPTCRASASLAQVPARPPVRRRLSRIDAYVGSRSP